MSTIATLAVSLTARTEKFNRGMGSGARTVEKMSKSIKRQSSVMKIWRSQWAWMVRSLGVFAVARGLLGGIGAIEKFNQAMAQSTAIMGDLSQLMRRQMRQAAIEMSRTTVFSAAQMAKAYFFLASAGLSAAQSLAALPIVAKFAQAGMFDMSRATDLLTDAQSALGMSVKDTQQNMLNMSRIGNVLVKANTLANATVEQLSQAMTTKAAAAFRLVGKDVEELAAVLAVFADQGIKGAEAGSGLAIVMRDMQTKAIKNSAEFQKMNIAVFDQSGEMRHLADIYEDLERRMLGMSDIQKKLTLLTLGFTDKSIAFTQALIGTSEKIRELDKALRGAGRTMSEVASKNMTEFQKQWNKLKADFIEKGEGAGGFAVGVLNTIMERISGLLDVTGLDFTGRFAAERAQKQMEFDQRRLDLAKKINDSAKRFTVLRKQFGFAKTERELNALAAREKEVAAAIDLRTRAMRDASAIAETDFITTIQEATIALEQLGKTELENKIAALDRIFVGGKVHVLAYVEAIDKLKALDVATKALDEHNRSLEKMAGLRKDLLTPTEKYQELLKEIERESGELGSLFTARRFEVALRDRAEDLARQGRKDRLTFGFEVARSTNIRFLNKNRNEVQKVEDKVLAKKFDKLAKDLMATTGIRVSRVIAPRGGIR